MKGLCDKCGGSGFVFRPERGVAMADKFDPCCACHTTGIKQAAHPMVLAVREERAKI